MSENEINANQTAIELAKQLDINIADIKKDGKITKKDVEDHYKSLNSVDDEIVETESDAEAKFVCVFNIKEGGTAYKAGEEYKGKNAKYLLERKSIMKA